jgi:hypothetical protein
MKSSVDKKVRIILKTDLGVPVSVHVDSNHDLIHLLSFEEKQEKDDPDMKHNWKAIRSSSHHEVERALDHQEKGLTNLELEAAAVENDQLRKKKNTKNTKPFNLFNSLLTFVGIAIAAIIGVFIRIGFGYYKIWKIDTNYVFAHPSLSFTSLFFSLILFLHLIIIIISHPPTLTLSRH